MNFLPWIIGGLVLGVAAWAVAAASAKPKLQASEDRLWVIGDSLGVGLLPRLVEEGKAIGIPVDGNPKGGTIVRQWVNKTDLIDPILDFKATACLVVLGTNDAASGPSYVADELPLLVHKLAMRLKQAGIGVIWIIPGDPPGLTSDKSGKVNSIIFNEAELAEFMVLDPRNTKVDYVHQDVHPTPAGYRALAGWIMKTLTTA